MKIRIGTRNSKLALIQTSMVILQLKRAIPDLQYDVIPIVTTGDKVRHINLYEIGGKALFLKEIEEQLLDNKIDLAVHSLKDVPGIISEGLTLAGVLERGDPRDCFLSLKYKSIDNLPEGSTVGSSSVRRKVLLKQQRSDLKILPFRGNVDTRLKKLQNLEVGATILSCVGLKRTNLFNGHFCFPLEIDQMLPSAGQGVIVIQIRSNNQKIQEMCNLINHKPTWNIIKAERAFVTYLNASCDTPMSAYAYYRGKKITARYMLSNLDGSRVQFTEKFGDISDVMEMGISAARELQERIL